MNIHLRVNPLRLALLAAACLFGATAPALAAGPPLRVLLFSGQNNHDWRTTTPKLRAILTGSGRFTVDVTEHPEQTTAETLARYDVIVSDWNAWGDAPVKEWPPATRTAFLDFIRGGKGYVSIHAGSSSFYDWPEYQQIGGLFWNLGPTSHGPPHEFPVEFVGDHPITRGLAPFRTTDELWLKPGMHPAAQLVATGDGQPLAVTTALGRGRGFALLLGHSAEYMNTPGFQSLLLRGTEWAATGEVTLRGAGDARGFDADSAIRRVAAYRFGDDREALLALEQLVQAAAADDATRSALAAKLTGALTAEASTEGKRAFLDGLSLLGTAAEVPALAKALTDSELLYHACQALARIPAPEAEAALITALGTTAGLARATVLQALASRRAASAVPAIARLVTDADPDVAAAALDALGTLGSPEATTALQTAENQIAPALRDRWAAALLRCAGSLRAEGKTQEAATVFAALARPGRPASVREAAFPAYVGLAADGAVADVLAALAGPDPVLRRAALRALWSNRQPALLKAAVDGLDVLSPEQQEGVLLLCGERGDASLLPAVTRAAASPQPEVRQAAVRTLGLIGNASAVDTLARLGGTESDEDQKAVVEALARLRGPGVDAAIRNALQAAPPARQRTLIRAVAAREDRTATLNLIAVSRSPDPAVRTEALRTLGRLADTSACAPLVQRLSQATPEDRERLEGALVEIGRRDPAAVPLLAQALTDVPPVTAASLVGVLGALGGSPACAAVRQQIRSDQPQVRLAAVRVLADWPDAEPIDDLATVVETAGDARTRAIAARGLNRMAPQAPARAARAAEALAGALAATTDATERKNLLGALIGIPSLPSLQAVQAQLKQPELASDTAAGLLGISEVIYPWHVAEVKAALADLRRTGPLSPELAKRADALTARLGQPANFALGGLASSPDGIEKDGDAHGDQAAIDGNPATYWDEVDNQKLYRLRVQLRQRSTIGCLRILGWSHQNHAPKDFEIRCDDRVVKTVTDAAHTSNWLTVAFPPVTGNVVELVITGAHGPSPAIRELEFYAEPPPNP